MSGPTRRWVRIGLAYLTVSFLGVAAVLHNLPHVVFHLRHPNDAVGSLDKAMSNGAQAFGAVLAGVLLVGVTRDDKEKSHARSSQ